MRNLVGGAGYYSYKNVFGVGGLEELLENPKLLLNKLQMFISSLSDKDTYTVLSVVRWSNYDSGHSEGITLGNSFKITRHNTGNLLTKKIRNEIIAGISRYGFDSRDSELVLMYKKWLDLSNFNCNLVAIIITLCHGYHDRLLVR